MEKELEYLGRALQQPGAAVRRHPRRRESLGQDSRHQLAHRAATWTRFSSAARWPTPSSRPKASTRASRSSRTRCWTRRARSKTRAEAEGVKLVLPTDHQVVDSYDPLNSRKTIPVEFTNQGLVGLDIGRETVALFAHEIEGAKTIIWNGPMGVFEEKGFEEGTVGVALAVAEAAEQRRDGHRRRRRLGLRHPAGRRRRQDHAHLDGRRRHPRIPRRGRAARRRGVE